MHADRAMATTSGIPPSEGLITFGTVMELAHELLGVEDRSSGAVPALYVGGRCLARFHGPDVVALRCDSATRAALVIAAPDTYAVPPGQEGAPGQEGGTCVLVRLDQVGREDLRTLLSGAWRAAAPPSLVGAYERGCHEAGAKA